MEGLTTMAPVSELPGRAVYGLTGNVGADLRMARERLGWDLASVSAQLRIRLPYLEAIEDGRVDDLPGNAYAVGFLRTYAAAVGLDPDEISRRFRAEVADVNRRTELVFPAPVPERGVPALAVVLVGLVIVIGAYAAWYKLSGSRQTQQEPVAAVPERLAPLAPPPAPPASVAAPQAAPAAAPAQIAAALPVPNPDGGRLVVRAKSDAWVQLKDKATGNVLADRVLKPGETLPIPNRTGLLLAVGNAGGTELLLDGQPTPSLGAEGVVRRNLPMEVDQVRDGKLAATYVVPGAPATVAPTTAAPTAQPRPATAN